MQKYYKAAEKPGPIRNWLVPILHNFFQQFNPYITWYYD